MTNIAGLGVDPGWRWTGAVLVVDGEPVDGFTLGPTDADGQPFRGAHDKMDPAATRRYCDRIGAHLDRLYDGCVDRYGIHPLVGVETPTMPMKAKNAGQYIARLRAFRITENVGYYVLGHYAVVEAFRFTEDHPHGKRHLAEHGGTGKLFDHYPKDLCWRRPSGWLVNEETDTSRDHERSAFDVAMRRIEMARSMLVAA